MVEDLGKVGDFDFNDIVFDVVPKTTTTTTVPFRTGIHNNNNDTQYECIIRAMGGTLDFTITVGNTSWTKSDEKNGFNVKTMYNTTGNYNPSEVLARFDVDGWVPAENKVFVTVVGNEGTFVLPFPEEGEIPYIICTNIAKPWSKEKVDVQTIGWFGTVENNCSIDLDVDDLK